MPSLEHRLLPVFRALKLLDDHDVLSTISKPPYGHVVLKTDGTGEMVFISLIFRNMFFFFFLLSVKKCMIERW